MKVNAVQIEEHGSGYEVTVRLHVGRAEAAAGDFNEFFGRVEERVLRGLDPEANATMAALERDGVVRVREEVTDSRESEAETKLIVTTPVDPREHGTVERVLVTEEAAPAGRRRWGAKAAAAEADPTPASSNGAAALADTPTGRRGRKSALAADATSPSDDVSGADLSKAASLAADKVGSAAVMKKLADDFKVTRVGDLQGEARGQFLAWAKAAQDE